MDFLRFVGRKACTDPAYLTGIDGDRTVLDALPRGGNITIRLELDGHPVQVKLPPTARDLLDPRMRGGLGSYASGAKKKKMMRKMSAGSRGQAAKA